METIVKGKFIRDFYGGKGYLSGNEQIKNWLRSQSDRLLNPRLRELKDALANEGKLEEILSVFNTDGDGYPIIGDWMLFECGRAAAKRANTWGRFGVSQDQWTESVSFTPANVHVSNGSGVIKEAEGVEGYAITAKVNGKRVSFFKAYQLIKAGGKFEFTIVFPEDLCTKVEGRAKEKQIVPDPEKAQECVNEVIRRMGSVGIGAYRRRFGKFETA